MGDQTDHKGNALYELLIQLTGIDVAKVKGEIDPLLERLGMSAESLTIEDVRHAMMVYLQEFSAQLSSEDSSDDHDDDEALTQIVDADWVEA